MKFLKLFKAYVPVLVVLLLVPLSVISGPTDPGPIEDHPWGGEQPPTFIMPDRSVINVGTPLIIYDAILIVADFIFSSQPGTIDEPQNDIAFVSEKQQASSKGY